ncbi:MAG TPA: hypothetical protein VMH83_07990 [Candidatus Acidoferrum sp.]|nr:hypothetical protein [Candidatus Acidoferrum sp.]
MSGYGKTTRYALITLAVMGAGFWTGVTFLGENWSDQGRYVLALLNLLLVILLCAAVLLGVFKLLALAWNKMIDASARQGDDDQDHNPQP